MRTLSRAAFAAAAVLITAVAGRSALHADTTLARPAADSARAAQQLPDGPGKEQLSKLCAGCHDLTFTVSTRETEEGWARIVNGMRSKGADGSEEDFAKVIAYLTANMGKPQRASASLSRTSSRND